MTGNKLLDYLLTFDSNTAVCELLELINKDEEMVIKMCKEFSPSFANLSDDCVLEIAKLCAILDYKLGVSRLPSWTRDRRLYLDKPLYIGNHLDDFTIAKMFIFAPQAFLDRNIYFNKEGLERV